MALGMNFYFRIELRSQIFFYREFSKKASQFSREISNFHGGNFPRSDRALAGISERKDVWRAALSRNSFPFIAYTLLLSTLFSDFIYAVHWPSKGREPRSELSHDAICT